MNTCALFLFTLILIGSAQPTISSSMCTSKSYIGDIQYGKHLEETSFYTINGIGLVGCARECIKRSRCQSFNFNLKTSECELNYCNLPNINNGSININNSINNRSSINNSSGKVHLDDDQYIFSDIETWPWRIAGLCHDHSCPENSSCQELEGELTCTVECHDPPPLNNGIILTFPIQYDVGSELNFTCYHGYKKIGSAICEATGQWSSFECSGACHRTPNLKFGEILTNGESGPWPFGAILEVRCNPGFYRRFKQIECKEDGDWNSGNLCAHVKECSQVQQCNPTYPDGEYWMFPKLVNYRKVRIYCHNMTSKDPSEFITLHNHMFEIITDFKSSNPLVNCTCHATASDKLRINIKEMKPILNVLHDFSLSKNSSCETKMLGLHKCCLQEIKVNITGTGLVFGSNESLDSLTSPIQLSADQRILKGHCLGKPCSGCDEQFKNMTLSYDDDDDDDDYTPEDDSATMPMCNT